MKRAFKKFFDESTIGMNRKERAAFKQDICDKTGKSLVVINNWLSGLTVPSPLEQKALNQIFGKQIY